MVKPSKEPNKLLRSQIQDMTMTEHPSKVSYSFHSKDTNSIKQESSMLLSVLTPLIAVPTTLAKDSKNSIPSLIKKRSCLNLSNNLTLKQQLINKLPPITVKHIALAQTNPPSSWSVSRQLKSFREQQGKQKGWLSWRQDCHTSL